jgi:hypothetical protein
MNKRISAATLLSSLAFALVALTGTAQAQTGGKFYGVWWDGSSEHFVNVEPFSGNHTSLAVVPGVNWVDGSFRIFDPDSGLYAFVGGGTTSAMSYQIIDAGTGAVVSTFPRNDNLKNPMYDPGTGMIYGTWWSDSSITVYDSVHNISKKVLKGTEFFTALNPRTGARTDTPIPGALYVATSSQFLDTDSGRYVVQMTDTANVQGYYVIDVNTGNLIARMPLAIKLDFPVYNPVLKAVHGLWWSDSTVREFDSLGRPKPIMPAQIKGTEYFLTIRPDSSVTMVELPGVKWIANLNRALDTDSGRYVFTGREATGGTRYYVIDVNTGAILSNNLQAGNVLHLVYAPFRSISYASVVGVRPMPSASPAAAWNFRKTSSGMVLTFSNAAGTPHSFELLDLNGKTLLHREGIRSGSVTIESEGLRNGMHLFRLTNGKGLVAAGKIRVE